MPTITPLQTIIGIVSISIAAIVGVVVLVLFGKDYTPVITLSAPTLAVLVGIVRLESNQQEIKTTMQNVADATNGKLDATIAAAKAMEPVPVILHTPTPTTQQEGNNYGT